jgi:hypothetical protein
MLAGDTAAPPGSAAASEQGVGLAAKFAFGVYAHPLIRSLYRESWSPLGRKDGEAGR